MPLQLIEHLNGIFSLIFVVISIYVGLRISSKYFKFKQKELILVGLTWVLLSEIWWASSISYLVALFNDRGLAPQIYFLIATVLVPIALLIWLSAFTDFLYKDKKWLFLIIAAIYSVIFEIYLFYSIITDYTLIGELHGPVLAKYTIFPLIFLISILIIFFITGILFARESLKSDNLKIKLKGKFLIIAMLTFFIGAIFDGLRGYFFDVFLTVSLIIARLLLIFSAIMYYCGFILPEWIEKHVLN